jgi:peptide/nickel transport system substrate-binding protein
LGIDSHTISRRRLIQLTAIAAAAAACQPIAPGQSASPGAAARKGGVIRASTLGGLPKVLHPYVESEGYTGPYVSAQTLMWASLVTVDYDKLEYRADPRGDLAKEMPKISADGKTFTFTLRDDIKWSDGKPITSADFLFAWQNASKKDNNWVGFDTTIDRIETFKTPDAKTVEITLKDKLARFLALNIVAAMTPVPKHIWEGKPWLDAVANPEVLKPSVVPGPYIAKELGAESHSYTRNPNWWGKQPNLDGITYLNANPNTVLELLSTKQVQWAESFPPAQYEQATKIEHVNVYKWTGASGTYRCMQFNLARPNMSEKKFREALARSMKREDFIQFENNLAVPQYGFYTQGNKWRFDGAERYDYDLNKAKQLLTDAGYKLDGAVLKDKDGKAVKIEVLYPTTSQPRAKMSAYAQQQWKQLGIETVVTGLEFNAFVDKYQRQKDFDVVMSAFGATLDPDGAKSQFVTDGSQNASGYSNKRVDQLFEDGAKEQDDAKRKTIYDELQKIAMDDLSQYFMTTLEVFTAFDKRVKEVVPLKGGDILQENNAQFLDWWITE